MEPEFRLAQCTRVHFEMFHQSEVVIFLLFRKDKETKCISVKISTTTTKKNGSRFIVKSMQIKNICDVVELHKNPRNPFQKRIVIP